MAVAGAIFGDRFRFASIFSVSGTLGSVNAGASHGRLVDATSFVEEHEH